MRVLLVSANVESLPDPVFPIGTAYVGAALKQSGMTCQGLDLCFEEDVEASIVRALQAFDPELVLISLRNVDNVSYPLYTSYLPFYQKVLAAIRNTSQATIVVGGSGFTLLPEAIFKLLQADYGVAGEGELAMVRLARHLAGQEPFAPIEQSPVIFPGDCPTVELDRLPPPDRSLFDGARYLKHGGMGNIQTKRGCPFGCIYCTYPLVEGSAVRTRSSESVCNEIETLLQEGIHTLFMVDNEFNHPLDHAMAVCREMIRRQLDVKWSCYAHPGFVTTKMVDTMQAAGCTSLEFGVDAACPDMLKSMGKNFSVGDILNASRICRQAGIPFCHSLLLGGPGETMDTVRQTLDCIVETDPTAVVCMVGIRVFPRTRLAAHALQEGLVGENDDFLSPVFYLSDAIADNILPFVKQFAQDHPTWIFPGLQININETLQQKLRRFGIKGPLWEYMQIGRRKASTAPKF